MLSVPDWKPWKNETGVLVPDHGLIRADEIIRDVARERLYLKGKKPFCCPMPALWVNSLAEVKADKNGSCHQAAVAYVRFDPSDGTPQPGQPWGVKEGGFKLRKGYGGFVVLKAPEESTDEIVLVKRVEHHVYMGVLDTDLTAPADEDEAWEDPPVADVTAYQRSVRADDDDATQIRLFSAAGFTLKDCVNRDTTMSAATGTFCKVEWIEGEWSFSWMACA